MAEDNNIKIYSVADIEKYWKGQLSNGEMHALEKAAMDDPFLADALEGYKNSQSPADEINLLHKKLAERISSPAKIFPLKKNRFYWLRVAAAIFILSGLGILAQQVLFTKKDNSISQLDKKETPTEKETANTVQSINKDSLTGTDNSKLSSLEKTDNKIISEQKNINKETVSSFADTVTPKFLDVQPQTEKLNEVVVGAARKQIETTSAPKQIETIKEEKKATDDLSKRSKDPGVVANRDDKLEDVATQKNKAATAFDKKSSGYISLDNKFNYKVVDAQNNPVPFANVSNTRDNVGTYTDIKGMFNLISSDTVLDVQIKSLGYNAKNYRLAPAKTAGNLVLEEDVNARMQILASNRKVVSSRSREETAELEEPEVGWDNYNTYVLNNIHIPDDIPVKKPGSKVELSFQVDKSGSPVNIKVTKSSSCKECDDAAVRVLKDGPKWSRKGKKSKTSVSIAVDKN